MKVARLDASTASAAAGLPVVVLLGLIAWLHVRIHFAALLGLGIAQSNWWTVRHDLAEGKLIEVLKPFAVQGQPISVVYPHARHVPRKLRVMIDFLVEITRIPDGAGKKSS